MQHFLSIWVSAFIPDKPDFQFLVEAETLMDAALVGLSELGLSWACAVAVQAVAGNLTGAMYADVRV